jgi:hypothetical protein
MFGPFENRTPKLWYSYVHCTYINVHTNKNDNTEVSVQGVADEQGSKYNPPSWVSVLKKVVA